MRDAKFTILIIALAICAIGILSIYSSTYQKDDEVYRDIYKRQIFWVLLGVALFLLISRFNYRRLWDITYILYAIGLLLLFLVFVLGITRLGAQRWLKFAWLNFQPSEFIKIIMIIFLARYFSRQPLEDISLLVHRLGIFRGLILPAILVAIPMGLIIEQPDLGTATMVMFIFVAMLYLAQVKLRYLIMLFSLALCTLPLFWFLLRDYQKERLLVFLNPNIDPLGAGYTIIQSKIAIGSGGLFGKGWLSGTQGQLSFLPEAHTDFIFATFAEEWGLVGAAVLLLLYYLLINQAIAIGLRTRDYFGKLLSFGIAAMLSVQVFVNIAMTMGLAPVVGIPLPLMSYGGSSVVMMFIALGILVNIDKTRAIF